ncbi:MAG: hypothetical protein ACLQLO_31380 [Mycobacterium sp.]
MLTAHETGDPLLIVGGEKDHTVPLVLTRSQFKHQEKDPGVTGGVELPNHGHSLTIDHGGPEVAQATPGFIAAQPLGGIPERTQGASAADL